MGCEGGMGMVLLVLDVQKEIMTENLYRFSLFRSCLQKLVEKARQRGTEVIFVRHDDGEGTVMTKGNAGFEIDTCVAPLPGERIFDKKVNSAFRDSGLKEYLLQKVEKDIMLVGLQTDYCMDATVKAGFEHEFRMMVPVECNTTFDNAYMDGETTWRFYNEHMWPGRYAKCLSFEEAMGMLE